MKTLIAILGPSGSGKSALGMRLAQELDAEIFSLDSLSIYKKINILSAKPSYIDRQKIKHYGIDILEILEHNNAMLFRDLLLNAIKQTQKKILLIIGGSGFYLKSIIEGLSPMPPISNAIKEKVDLLHQPYAFLQKIDSKFATSLNIQDSYRITKALEIYFATNTPPSLYFANNPPKPFAYPIAVFALQIDREALKIKVQKRTALMLENGGIEEMQNLLEHYPKTAQPFKAIGPKECIAFLENKIDFSTLKDQINTHTMQLAKRQNTFNKTQFKNLQFLQKDKLFDEILRLYRA